MKKEARGLPYSLVRDVEGSDRNVDVLPDSLNGAGVNSGLLVFTGFFGGNSLRFHCRSFLTRLPLPYGLSLKGVGKAAQTRIQSHKCHGYLL